MIGRKLLNRYKITQHLGDGSTATVYKAVDDRLGREVAIKMLLPHVRDNTRERFFQEATSAAQLNHPNIMAIYDIDQEDDRPFLVIEYVEGQTLDEYIPSAPNVLINLGAQIARALQYAHDREIIHRDIKPANIKVTSGGQVKLMDLGLALPREGKRVTAQGMVIGTPAYLSPEQAQGHTLDHRTDIYSLGIVLYEMATGMLSFNADDIGALLLQQVKQAPPPPRLVVGDLPAALESVILKTLSKNPAQRFQSCGALAAALESALSEVVTSADDSPKYVSPDADTIPNKPKGWPLPSDKPTVSTEQTRVLRVILADDHKLLRKSLGQLLETHEGFVVVAEAGDGVTALEQTVSILPDVLLLDLNMPGKGGLDILPEVRSKAPKVKVLVLTGRDEDAYIIRALRAGAHGYILKSAEENDLVDAISRVMKGQLVLGQGVAEKVVGEVLSPGSTDTNRLNDEEARVLLYVAAGYENEHIAEMMKMGLPDLVEKIAQTMNKLDVRDRHSAALKALRSGYILLEDLHNLQALS